jgi:hypothetical protein
MGRLFSRQNVSNVPDITSYIAKRVADFRQALTQQTTK